MRRDPPHTSPRGLAAIAVAAVFLAAGFLADEVVIVLWGAVPLVVVVLDRAWAVAGATRLHPPRTAPGTSAGLSLAWADDDPPGGVLGTPLVVCLRFRLSPGLRVRGLSFRPVGSSALTFLPEAAPPDGFRGDGEVPFNVVAAHVGAWFAHGVVVSSESPLGLHRHEVWRPLEVRIRAWPRPATTRLARPFVATRATIQEGADRTRRPQRGLSSELRELREHAPGDPFKHIAWKATARTGRLIVKEFDAEFTLSVYLALDLSPPMRAGVPGATPLDRAVDVAWTLVSHLARGRDRVGYVAFDSRVLAFRRATMGRKAEAAVVQELLGVHQRVDEDLTAVTFGELVVRVADYLERQRGVAFGGRRWRPDTAGPVPDPSVVLDHVADEISGAVPVDGRRPAIAEDLARDPDSARLRQYCREHGIELPYRPACSPSDRARGIHGAFERIVQAGGGPHVLVVITEMGTVASEEALVRAIQLARSHRNRVVVLVPRPASPPSFAGARAVPPPVPAVAVPRLTDALADLYGEDEARRRTSAVAVLRRAGATVLTIDDAARLPALLRHLQRAVR